MTHAHGRAVVLLEGTDKAGKSTTARALARGLEDYGPVESVHFSTPEPYTNPFLEYRDFLLGVAKSSASFVVDRLHWSQWAYQEVYRPGEPGNMSAGQVHLLDRLLGAVGGVVVLKDRDAGEVVRAMDSADYGEAKLARVEALQEQFDLRATESAGLVSCFRVPWDRGVPGPVLAGAAIARSRWHGERR